MIKLSTANISFCLSVLVGTLSQAAASDWGCKVLLCAASDNPSWQSVPSCLPPMYKLIACRSKTFGACPWPTCPEGGTGNPAYQKFEDCPAGWRAQASSSTSSGNREFDICVQRASTCDVGRYRSRDVSGSTCIATMPRPLRLKPYNFQIRNSQTNLVETHWFSLKK